MWLLKRKSDGKFVSFLGKERWYTSSIRIAQKYRSEAAALSVADKDDEPIYITPDEYFK